MRKEVLFAIILGIGLGLTAAFGIWRANLALAPKVAQKTEAPQVLPEPTNSSELIVTQPENNLVVSEDTITIKGAATPGATIAITTGQDGYIFEAGSDGSFEKEVKLAAGPNEVKIVAFDESGNQAQERLVIVYTTELSKAE